MRVLSLNSGYVSLLFVALLGIGMFAIARADPQQPFHFESLSTLDDMQQFIEKRFPLGSSRESLRKTFVNEGKATLKIHPTQANVEKYLYDINLCSYYVWRWNISADYDPKERLLQAYLNGNPVFKDGTPKKDVKANVPPSQKAAILRVRRPRPEASKGESFLAAVMLDMDADPKTIDDQVLIGGGPTRADPKDMGKLLMYEVEPWRSIFDTDTADHIVPYSGDCAQVDALAEKVKQQQRK